MIPVLFNKEETTFTSLGLGEIDATVVEVERERNGIYSLYMELPFSSDYVALIEQEMQIKTDAGARTKWQTFKVNRVIKDTDKKIVKVYADHISMDTINDAMKPRVAIRQQTAEGALRQWNANRISTKQYDVSSDITTVAGTTWTIDEVENARQALGGVEGSILDVWGGEYEFDNNTIILHKEMGREAPTVLEYGRNIVSLEYEELIDGVYTSIYPYATYTPRSEDNRQQEPVMVTLDELIVDGDYAGNFENRRIQIVDFSGEFDSSGDNPEMPTQTKLRSLAKSYVKANEVGAPKVTQEIDFVDLSKTLDYADMQVMEEIELNDRVPIFYPNIKITSGVKVTKTIWQPLINQYKKITVSTIGALKSSSLNSDLKTSIKELEKQQKQINNQLPYMINSQGNRIWYTTPDDTLEHKIGDTWFKKNGKYTIIYKWNGSMWEEVSNEETFTKEIEAEVSKAQTEAEKASQSAKEADDRANQALEKVGINTDLLNEHYQIMEYLDGNQQALNQTIYDTQLLIGDVSNDVTQVSYTAQSALANAQLAVTEANKTDGKIADYVSRNGLVNGTTVDSKIDNATGEINRKITTVESKIPTELGGRNLLTGTHAELKSYTKSNWDFNPQRIDSSKLEFYGIKVGTKLTYRVYIDNPSEAVQAHIQFVKNPIAYVQHYGNQIKDGQSGYSLIFLEVTENDLNNLDYIQVAVRGTASSQTTNLAKKKLEIGIIPTDWSPAPEDNYSQEEFSIFESTYNEDVKGINSSLTSLENSKLDGSTYTNFYENDYKQTAQSATDAYTAVNKIVDANGNAKDTFAKAIYDRNATRQKNDFQEVTKDLVKTATYESGIDGVRESVTTLEGDIAKSGNPNLVLDSNKVVENSNYNIANYDMTKNLIGGETYTITVWGDFPIGIKAYHNGGGSINHFASVAGGDNTLKLVDVNKYELTVTINKEIPQSSEPTLRLYQGSNANRPTITIDKVMITKGNYNLGYQQAPEDLLGKEEFSLFKRDYEATDKLVQETLTAIESDTGSLSQKLNTVESTANGNKTLLTTINNNYVTQSNIDTSILSDKKIKDTRSTNQPPNWYFSNYPSQEVREFKNVSTMGIGSGTYGILTTNVPWSDSSGGTVKQTFETNTEIYNRQSNTGGTVWGEWSKQIDTSDITYQKITETSSLYERVLGSTENDLNTNVSRIVQTSNVIQQTVTSAMNVENRNLLITKNATRDSWLTGSEGYPNPTIQANSGTSTSPDLIEVKSGDKFTLSKNESTAYFRISFLNSSKKYIGRYVQNDKVGTIVPPTNTAYLWVSYPTDKDAKVEKGTIATGFSLAPEDTATQSQITQLADNINLKVSNKDLLSEINVQAKGVLIQSGTNKLNVTPTTTYIANGTIKNAMIESLNAGKITAGTLDASKVTVSNIDASNITANVTSFLQTNWYKANGENVRVDGSGMYTTGSGSWRRTYFTPTGMDLFNGQSNKAGAIGYFKASRDYSNGNYGNENIMWGDRQRHTIGVGVNYNHVLSLGYVSSSASIDNGYNDALTVDPQASGTVSIHTSLDMLSRPIENAYRLNFRHGGYIFGQQNSSMYYNASMRHDLAIAGSTKLAVDGTIRAYTGIDMNGNDLARVGKLSYNSDQRLKTNIKDTQIRALDAIRNWQLVSYDWLESGEHVDIGLIAQNSPEIMTYDAEYDVYGIDAGKQTMINTLAIKETDDEVAQLKAQVASLQDELALLKGD